MSYVDLKHLLADLTLEALKNPEKAAWAAVALACAELASAEQPRILWRDCLQRAAALSAPFGWKPTKRHITRIVKAGLFGSRGDLLIFAPQYVPYLDYARRHMARLLKALAEMRTDPRLRGKGQAVRVGAVLFNSGLFFECHEWFEGIWKTTAGPAKDFYHGIVQVAAAFYHYEKRNLHGSRTLLAKGLRRLDPYPGTYAGVDLSRLKAELGPWAEHFAGGPRPADFPLIHYDEEKTKGAPRG